MPAQSFTLAAMADNLRRVCIIRLLVIAGISGAILLAGGLDITLPRPPLITILCLLGLYTAATFWRLGRHWPVTELEFFSHLLTDIVALGALIYFSGGASNPFISYLLVPLSISAATLAWGYTWTIAAICVACYTLLLYWYVPLPIYEVGHHSDGLNAHLLGMWLNFLFSAALITYFVVKMATALRQQEAQLNDMRDDERQDEQIMAIATLAAGTAHELGTPLATVSLLAEELALRETDDTDYQADIKLLAGQIAECKAILQKLARSAEPINSSSPLRSIGDLLDTTLEHWQLLRPEVDFSYQNRAGIPGPRIKADASVEQALLNLLNNAADACPSGINIELSIENRNACIVIEDQGAGVPMELAEQLGKPFMTTKGKGLGLGLFLSHATVNRYGGRVTLFNRPQGGTRTELLLPLAGSTNHG